MARSSYSISWSILLSSFVAGSLLIAPSLQTSRCPGIGLLGSAEALPAFARKYNADCTLCHSVWPRLNRAGYEFRRLGYRMPWEVKSRRRNPPDHGLSPVARGQIVFEEARCTFCHFGGGNIVDPKEKIKGEKFAKQYSDEELAKIIRDGIAYTAMPSYDTDHISDVEMTDLIAYIRSLSPPAPPSQTTQ